MEYGRLSIGKRLIQEFENEKSGKMSQRALAVQLEKNIVVFYAHCVLYEQAENDC